MVFCDTIVENNSIFLENLTSNTSTDWKSSSAGAYMIYSIPYTKPLLKDHLYYYRCVYKYTTSNQKPTWCGIYCQGGMSGTSAIVNNPQPNTEYTLSGYAYMTSGTSYTLWEGQIYNGSSNAISGVTGYVKNMVVYDVTSLFQHLKAKGKVTDENSMVTWCNTNLYYHPCGEAITTASPGGISAGAIGDNTKIVLKSGGISCTPIECDGMEWYSVSEQLRNNTYFDSGSGVYVYNNNGNGTVTHTRVDAKAQNSPFYPEHKYVLKITTNGSASPSCGGFVAEHTAAANKYFIERFVAKVPVGYNVTAAYNSQGTGNSVTYLTSRAGTGNWEEYAILYKCGSSGTFSTGGHVYLIPDSGYSSTSVTWYLAYVNNCDITSDKNLAYYTALPDKEVLKSEDTGKILCNKLFSRYFNTVNLFPNGDGSDTSMTLPSGWTWDKDDIAGNAKASIVQPKGASAGYLVGGKMGINPHYKYKISMWVKCKQDMSSFLVAICPYVGNTALGHSNVIYVPGTKTQLSADLVKGATQMTVKSNANWKDVSYGHAGFRTSQYYTSWNDKGTSHGVTSAGYIQGTSGSNIVTFKSAYNGATIPAGTVVVESRAGSNYPYPIQKGHLPTDNNWKYVEGYFGADNVAWDGSSANNAWEAMPSGATHIGLALNIYGNDGSVPIKYADIKIEECGPNDGERHMNIIQFKKFD